MLNGFRVCSKSGAFINCGPSTARLRQAVEEFKEKEKELDLKLAKADRLLARLARLDNVEEEETEEKKPVRKTKREK